MIIIKSNLMEIFKSALVGEKIQRDNRTSNQLKYALEYLHDNGLRDFGYEAHQEGVFADVRLSRCNVTTHFKIFAEAGRDFLSPCPILHIQSATGNSTKLKFATNDMRSLENFHHNRRLAAEFMVRELAIAAKLNPQ